jgi:hypothetical protein
MIIATPLLQRSGRRRRTKRASQASYRRHYYCIVVRALKEFLMNGVSSYFSASS